MSHKSKSRLRLRSMKIYRNDIVLGYSSDIDSRPTEGKRKQGALTAKSIQNLAFYAQNTSIDFKVMVTLTYPSAFPGDGKDIKRHLNTFLSWCRSRFTPFSYLWFLEFQRRGAPHFHILTDSDMVSIKHEVSVRWYETVGSHDTKHLKAGTRCEYLRKVDGAARYATYYTSKMYQKTIPPGFVNVGRWWGNSRDVVPEPVQEYDISGMTGRQLQDAMEKIGWEYHESLTKPLKILYNAAKYTRQSVEVD